MPEKPNPSHFEHSWATRWLVPAVLGLLLAALIAVIVLSLI